MKATLVLLIVALFAVAYIHADDGIDSIIDNANVQQNQTDTPTNTVINTTTTNTVINTTNVEADINATTTNSADADANANVVTPADADANANVVTPADANANANANANVVTPADADANANANVVTPADANANANANQPQPQSIHEAPKADGAVQAAAVAVVRVDQIPSVTSTNVNVTFNNVTHTFANVTVQPLVISNNTGAPMSNYTCYYIEASNDNANSTAETNNAILVAQNATAKYPNQFSFTFRIFNNSADFATIQTAANKAFPGSNITYNPFFIKGCNTSNLTLVGNYEQFLAEMAGFVTGDASSIFSSVIALSSVTIAAAMLLL